MNGGATQATIGVLNNLHNPHLELYEAAIEKKLPAVLFKCGGRFDLITVSEIRRFASTQNIDIIHCHGYKSNMYGLTATVFSKVKKVSTVHNWIKTDRTLIVYSVIDKILLRFFDAIVAVSGDIKNELISSGIPLKKISTISNGIGLERFSSGKKDENLRKELGFSPGDKIIGTVGRMSQEKGHIHLLEAAKRVMESVPGTKLLIAGDGPLRSGLEQAARVLGISDKVVFAGVRKDIPRVLSIIDIFVLPSLVEGMPIALLEAMASGKCIIASETGDIPKLIINGQTGILVKPGDTDGLHKAMVSLLNDESLSVLLAGNAYRKVVNEYSSENMSREYTSLYSKLYN